MLICLQKYHFSENCRSFVHTSGFQSQQRAKAGSQIKALSVSVRKSLKTFYANKKGYNKNIYIHKIILNKSPLVYLGIESESY